MSDNGDRRETERKERKEPPNIDGMFTLKIDNISSRVTNELLKEKFGVYGEVGDVYIPRQFGSTEPRGYAFVRYVDKNAAEDAMRSLNETEFEGLVIRVQEAKARRPENPKQFYARRGGGGDRGSGGRGGYNNPRDSYRRDSRDRRDYRGETRDYGRDGRDYRGGRDDFRGDYGGKDRGRSRSRERYGGGGGGSGNDRRSRSRSNNGRRY